MLIPRHWASFRVEGKNPKGRRRVALRYGWSDESVEAAQQHAEARARQAMSRIESGESPIAWRDRADIYGSDVVPIREEVISRDDDTVVTRNAYGALCLNTADVFFADIDTPPPPPMVSRKWLWAAFVALTAIAGLVFGRSGLATITGLMAGVALAILVDRGVSHLERIREMKSAPAKRIAWIDELKSRFGKSTDILLRVYETPAGFRVAVESTLLDATSEEASRLFTELKSDSKFVRLCKLQRCFRARVSPKPWRCGHKALNKAEGGATWPVLRTERLHLREKWCEAYEQISKNHAACRLVATVGLAPAHEKASRVLDVHDRLSRAREQLPLA